MKALVAKTTLVALKDLKCKRLEDGYTEHPQDRIYQALEKELEKDGLLEPILVRESTMEPIRGNQRCWFAKKNGYTHISVIYDK
jgi:ParB-like chromosome segregation protein Spo0J